MRRVGRYLQGHYDYMLGIDIRANAGPWSDVESDERGEDPHAVQHRPKHEIDKELGERVGQ